MITSSGRENRNRAQGARVAALGLMLLGALLARSFGQNADEEAFRTVDPNHAIIGANVVGPGSGVIGEVKDLVINRESGEVEMYLVKTNGWFGSYGVIPLDFVETRTEIPGEEGNTFLIGVRINESTFDNLAKWNAKGSIGQYLRRYRSLLSTVYGLSEEGLENAFERYALASTQRGGDESVAMSELE